MTTVLTRDLYRRALDPLAEALLQWFMDVRIAQEIAQLAMEMAGAGAENSDRWRWENRANHAQMSNVREIEWAMKYDG